ncbi:hypothetical protein H5410_058614 [Solanum commersonii]|uniref:Uncharacterized protein n=1 Tax=Solanum commersonii TaxID=4109 RepID=A0A9J5WU09_SOLCO|nr:hypothetical protein H5410_058614 [Solanum commersonii]
MDILGNLYIDPLPLVIPTTTSSTTFDNNSNEEVMLLLASKISKRRGGRKKLHETRHPVYRGVRWKNFEKWVNEVRVPGISACLNFADSAWRLPVPASATAKDIQKAAAEAAEAFRVPKSLERENSEEVVVNNDDHYVVDSGWRLAIPASAAATDIQKAYAEAEKAFRPSESSKGEYFEEVDSTWRLSIPASAVAKHIQKAAAEAFGHSESSEGENYSEEVIINDDQMITQYLIDSTWRLPIPAATEAFCPSKSSEGENSKEVTIDEQVIQDIVVPKFTEYNELFMDEVAIFYMPELLVNMAEGLMLPPPQCIYGMEPHDIDMSLWSYQILTKCK